MNNKTMRPIKFRGKRIDNGEWVYGCLILSTKDAWIVTDDSSIYEGIQISHLRIDNISKVHRETVGQFTGLTDKNGREVYEGDEIHNAIVWGAKVGGFISYNQLRHFWHLNAFPLSANINFDQAEIVGNIHEGGSDE